MKSIIPSHRPGRLPSSKTHQPARPKRPSASARGYGSYWRRIRDRQPKTDCVKCEAEWQSDFHLDHKISRKKGGNDDQSNLEWLCPGCHSRKTAADDGGFGNPVRR